MITEFPRSSRYKLPPPASSTMSSPLRTWLVAIVSTLSRPVFKNFTFDAPAIAENAFHSLVKLNLWFFLHFLMCTFPSDTYVVVEVACLSTNTIMVCALPAFDTAAFFVLFLFDFSAGSNFLFCGTDGCDLELQAG